MTPTIVIDSSGRALLIVGSRGGPRIITSVTQVLLNVLEHRMSLADAMRAPRLHHRRARTRSTTSAAASPPAVIDSLRAMGHTPIA